MVDARTTGVLVFSTIFQKCNDDVIMRNAVSCLVLPDMALMLIPARPALTFLFMSTVICLVYFDKDSQLMTCATSGRSTN